MFNTKNKEEALTFSDFNGVEIFTFNGFGKYQMDLGYTMKKLDNTL